MTTAELKLLCLNIIKCSEESDSLVARSVLKLLPVAEMVRALVGPTDHGSCAYPDCEICKLKRQLKEFDDEVAKLQMGGLDTRGETVH